MKEIIFSFELCQLYRKAAEDFTRDRLLPFGSVVVLMLSGKKVSLQNALNKFFTAIGKVFAVPSASAYCQAKQKVQAEVFVHLNQSVTQDFYRLYGAEDQVTRWHGHRLVGADGTYLNLPDTKELRQAFSVHRNQHTEEKSEQVQALGLVLYDLLNDLGLRAALAPSHSAEKSLLFNQLWSELQIGDVLVLDRQSADYTIIAQALRDKLDVVIRCPRQSFKPVMEFFKSRDKERLVSLSVPQHVRTQKYVQANHLPETVEVRLLKFKLESGEDEVLLTTLCDQKKYPSKEFFKVYGFRWRDETFYDRIKNIFELERFSGLSEESIKQDFYGVIFLASLESVLSRETEIGMQEAAAERETKTVPQVNHAISYVALVGQVASLLADPTAAVEETLRELKHLFRTNPTRVRKGRKYERKKPTHARKLRYHRYTKRVLA
ncbi:MAG: IS4 family transposase [Acidobacteria bacterium]|nr:IS4 family transposase [Acidobacteriota bacterium]